MGIDAHKKTLAIAVLRDGEKPEELTIDNDEKSIRKLARRLTKSDGEVRACYEAGTCGFTLQRRLEAGGTVCKVIAPSLIPRKPGERMKTDRRDALKLAELQRANVLTTISPPSLEQEAMRDLCRCREAVRADLGRCRHRLVKMLVRRGLVFNPNQRLGVRRTTRGSQECPSRVRSTASWSPNLSWRSSRRSDGRERSTRRSKSEASPQSSA